MRLRRTGPRLHCSYPYFICSCVTDLEIVTQLGNLLTLPTASGIRISGCPWLGLERIQKKKSMVEYLRLMRFQTAAATASVPVIGGLVMGQDSLKTLAALFLAGLGFHVYGFVLNEYMDVGVDRKCPDLQKRPLVKGAVPRWQALMIAGLACVFAFGIMAFFFLSFSSMLFLLLAFLLGGAYDVFGKKMVGLDLLLGLSFFCLSLFGASPVSDQYPVLILLVGSVFCVHILFNNAVEGGLKDVDHDAQAGARTLALVLGVRIQGRNLRITAQFVLFAVVLKAVFFFLMLRLSVLPGIHLWSSTRSFLPSTAFVLLTLAQVWPIQRFLSLREFDREKLKRLFSVHEMASYFMLILVISPLIGLAMILLLVLIPSIWYLVFNSILYGKPLQPFV